MFRYYQSLTDFSIPEYPYYYFWWMEPKYWGNCTDTDASRSLIIRLVAFQLKDTGTELELKQAIEHFRGNLQHSINPKNLNRYITAYMQ